MKKKLLEIIKESKISLRAVCKLLEISLSTVNYQLLKDQDTPETRKIKAFIKKQARKQLTDL